MDVCKDKDKERKKNLVNLKEKNLEKGLKKEYHKIYNQKVNNRAKISKKAINLVKNNQNRLKQLNIFQK